MRELLHETADLAADFLESLPDRPVFPRVEVDELRARLGGPVPEGPTDAREVVRELAAAGDAGAKSSVRSTRAANAPNDSA